MYRVVVAGVTDKLPVGPTLPIPGVIPMAVALETSQLKVEDPRNMLGGVATKELIMGKPPDGAVGVVAGVVDDDGAFAGVEVPGEGTVI
jgi:hypothetical protein